MQVDSIMTSPPVTVAPDATLKTAIGSMLQHRVGSVLVVDPGLAGILTRSDVLRIAYHRGGSLSEIPASAGMTEDVVTTEPATSVGMALKKMQANDIKKLPVVDDLELVGIVTMTDIARQQPERAREISETIDRKDDWTD